MGGSTNGPIGDPYSRFFGRRIAVSGDATSGGTPPPARTRSPGVSHGPRRRKTGIARRRPSQSARGVPRERSEAPRSAVDPQGEFERKLADDGCVEHGRSSPGESIGITGIPAPPSYRDVFTRIRILSDSSPLPPSTQPDVAIRTHSQRPGYLHPGRPRATPSRRSASSRQSHAGWVRGHETDRPWSDGRHPAIAVEAPIPWCRSFPHGRSGVCLFLYHSG